MAENISGITNTCHLFCSKLYSWRFDYLRYLRIQVPQIWNLMLAAGLR